MPRRQPLDLTARQRAVEIVRARFLGCAIEWGAADCVQSALLDLAALGRPYPVFAPYHDERSALRALRALGFRSLRGACGARFPEIAPAAALPGDIVAFPGDGRGPVSSTALGVCAGDHALAWGPTFAPRPLGAALLAWRV